MSRLATWRRGPNDPDTARRWLFRNDLRFVTVDRRRTLMVLGTFGSALAALGLLCLFAPRIFHVAGPFGPCLMGMVSVALNRIAPPQTGPSWVEIDEPGEAFRVRMTVRDRRGAVTGSDHGLLIFSEGWLLFEGARTSFAVTRGEAVGRVTPPTLTITLEDDRTVQFGLPTYAPRSVEMKTAYYLWSGMAIPDGEAVLPPKDVHPEVWVGPWTFCVAGAAAFLFATGLGLCFGLTWMAAVTTVGVALSLSISRGIARRLRNDLPRVLGTRHDVRESTATSACLKTPS